MSILLQKYYALIYSDSRKHFKFMYSKQNNKMAHQSSALYGLAFIGALIYFIKQATTFGAGILGFLKAIIWPVILIYKVFEFLKV